jgi:hypothetical protein
LSLDGKVELSTLDEGATDGISPEGLGDMGFMIETALRALDQIFSYKSK